MVGSSALAELVQPDRVHRRVYTDPAIFDAEMRLIFGRTWVFVGHESEVAHPGDYKAAYIGRQPMVMSRHTDGQVYVLYNRCMHRGALVCREESGNSKFFRCLYHGWTYANDGALSGVPFRSGYPPDFDFDSLGLMRVPRAASYRGFVFASLSPEGQCLEDFLGPAKRSIDAIVQMSPEGRIEARQGVIKYEFRGNWKYQCENFVDHYHATFTHESAFASRYVGKDRAKLGQEARDAAEVRAYPHGHGEMFHPSDTRADEKFNLADGYLGALEAAHGRDRVAEILSGDLNIMIYPNLLFQQHSQSFRIIRPLAVDHTQVLVYPYRLPGAPETANDQKVRSVSWWASASGTGQPDDLEAFERIQEGL
ncbi:MAG TPA: aromatic ring-hydroxylating dioxygenase subunit alpha [Chloroflexota bacterium]|nr:aromatic ring-hydroxylating dioxygenase subunit alpha [Chloroflexota bacterium]